MPKQIFDNFTIFNEIFSLDSTCWINFKIKFDFIQKLWLKMLKVHPFKKTVSGDQVSVALLQYIFLNASNEVRSIRFKLSGFVDESVYLYEKLANP